jgi:hypothetical protein
VGVKERGFGIRRGEVVAFVILILGTAGIAVTAAAQTGAELVYAALNRTPTGGLPPLATSTILNDVQSGVAFAARYGYVPAGIGLPRLNNFAGTAEWPLGIGSTVSLTAGASSATSASYFITSVAGDRRISALTIVPGPTGSRIDLAVNGELAYSKPRDISVWSGAVGVPLSFVQVGQPRDAMRIIPFVTPSFAFGNYSSDIGPSQSGTQFMLGGGLGVYNRTSTVALSIGFQIVAVANGQAQVGMALTLGGR